MGDDMTAKKPHQKKSLSDADYWEQRKQARDNFKHFFDETPLDKLRKERTENEQGRT